MAVALNPNARLFRTSIGAPPSFSVATWTRLDTPRGEDFTVVRYAAGNSVGGGGFQPTLLADNQLIIFEAKGAFPDILGGAGPVWDPGDWWFLGWTTIVADIPDNVEVYWGRAGDPTLTQVTASYDGAYQFQNWYVGSRPGTDGQDGAFWLDGSVAHDRIWQDVTLTPEQMLAEFLSDSAVLASPYAVWPMADSATVVDDASGNSRPLTQQLNAGSIVTTDGPFDSDTVDLAGHADAAATALGALTVRRLLAGHADAAGTALATLTVRRQLAGHADAAASAAGQLTGTVQLAGHADAASTAFGAVTVRRQLAGHADAAAAAHGVLTVADLGNPAGCNQVPIPSRCRPVRAVIGETETFVTCDGQDVEPEADLVLACD